MNLINYNRHFVDKKDLQAVFSCLKGNNLTQGDAIIKFERDLKKKFKSKHCLAVSNGTAALHLSLIALNVKKKDIVCSSPITFLSGANMVAHCGGTNMFIDIDKKTNNIDVNKLEDILKKKKIKAVMATDYGGYPCDWRRLKFLSKKYNFYLINDNCHAIGSKYRGDIGYAVKYADLVTHSYHAVKNITTGEGGSILTNNNNLFKKIYILRNHGLKKTSSKFQNPNWPFELKSLGFNYRITDFQCALGSSQLKKLNKFIQRRNEIAKIYFEQLKGVKNLELPHKDKKIYNSYHLFPIKINFKKNKVKKRSLIKKLKKKGINLQVHYFPIHKHSIHKKGNTNLKIAEKFYQSVVSLPIYYTLSNKKIIQICNLAKKFIY